MPTLELWQWAVLATAVAVVIGPRLIEWAKRNPLGSEAPAEGTPPASACDHCASQQAGTAAEPAAHAKIDAFATIAADLTPQLAEEVWAAIQPKAGGRSNATPMG